MKLLKDFFRVRLPERPAQIKPGIYHYRREAGGNVTRFHLRVEEDGSGILLANASVAARLTQTGVLIAKTRLEGVSYQEISKRIKENFTGASEAEIESDVRKITRIIGQMANLEDNYPVFNLDDPAIVPPRKLLAPFHAQLESGAAEKINPLLEKLWDSGIMHVTFANPASHSEAILNVERAEDLGMISGVRATAVWFLSDDVLTKLARSGIDYILLPAVSKDPQKQDEFFGENSSAALMQCIEESKKLEVTPVLEIAVIRQNVQHLEQMVNEFSARGVKNVLYYAVANTYQNEGLEAREIIEAASIVEEMAHRSDVRYVWLPAVSVPGELKEVLQQGPRTAGDVSIRVNADGYIYPPRGPLVAAGNLMQESFRDIWNQDIFKRYRERVESPTRCEICPELEICGADCPANPNGWATGGSV